MKHLKKYNEELTTRFPQYKRGEVVIYANDHDIDTDFVKRLVKKFGYKCIGEIYDTGFVIEVPKGEEVKAGKTLIEKYPEFFDSYDRLDINSDSIYTKCDEIVLSIENLRDSIGKMNQFGTPMLPKNWNKSIDNIVSELNKLRHG